MCLVKTAIRGGKGVAMFPKLFGLDVTVNTITYRITFADVKRRQILFTGYSQIWCLRREAAYPR